jgi:hypothetical protein
MATQTGIDATVKIGTTTILDMANWTVTDTKEPISAPVFGEDFNKVHGMGIRNVSGNISGYLNTADTTGQNTLESAFASGGYIDDFRLYFNSTEYYKGTKVYITTYNSSATSEDAVVPISFDFVASENWIRTTD